MSGDMSAPEPSATAKFGQGFSKVNSVRHIWSIHWLIYAKHAVSLVL